MSKKQSFSVIEENQREILKDAWKFYHGNVSAIADYCDISKPTVLRWLRKYGIYEPLRRGK